MDYALNFDIEKCLMKERGMKDCLNILMDTNHDEVYKTMVYGSHVMDLDSFKIMCFWCIAVQSRWPLITLLVFGFLRTARVFRHKLKPGWKTRKERVTWLKDKVKGKDMSRGHLGRMVKRRQMQIFMMLAT